MAEGKVTLPIIGDVDKKYATIGVIAAGGVAVVVYIEKRRAAQSAMASAAATTAATASTSTDPAGNVGTIDPATGYVYGSPQDEAALSQAADAGYSDYGGLDTAGGTGDIDPETGYEVGSIADEQALGEVTATTGTSAQSTPSTGISTNSQWVTQAVATLPGDSSTITTALTSVLGGLTVTTAQQQLFMEAVGLLGAPPGGYPTPIKTSDTAGQPGTGTTRAAFSPTSVVGETLSAAGAALSSHGYNVAYVRLNGAPAPLPGAAATVPYNNTPVTSVTSLGGKSVELIL